MVPSNLIVDPISEDRRMNPVLVTVLLSIIGFTRALVSNSVSFDLGCVARVNQCIPKCLVGGVSGPLVL